MKLWRPVGMHEMALVFEGGMTAFPPRLPSQPIFYPVLNRGYAEQIARDWNTEEPPFAGYVTEFEIDDAYAERLPRRVVGRDEHEELWIPAEELDDFNRSLAAPIRVVSAYFGPRFTGHVPASFGLAGKDALEQLRCMSGTRTYAGMDFICETAANAVSVFLNFPYWTALSSEESGLDAEELEATLAALHKCWSMRDRAAPLVADGQRTA